MQIYKKPLKGPTQFHSSGQVLPIGIGLLAVAIIVIFMVLNSGRAVNEKINLVNAADAAAYSGGQVVARHLNYMAYTNRAMIANEVAIGHSFSIQAEMDVLQDWAQTGVDSLLNSNSPISIILNFIIWILNLLPGVNIDLAGAITAIFDVAADSSKVVTSLLNLMYNANTAKFSNYQQLAYLDLIAQDPGTGLSVVGATMKAVADTYVARPTAPISVNHPATIAAFINDPDASIQSAAGSADTYDQQVCQMILFAQPSQAGALAQDDLSQACIAMVNGVGGVVEADEDGAVMMELIQGTYTDLDSGSWIQERNTDYTMPLFLVGVNRRGQSDLAFQDGHITWVADDQITAAGVTGTVNGDVNSFVDNARAVVDNIGLQALSDLGACDASGQTEDGDSCSGLYNKEYRSIERYAVLNQGQDSALITAFLSQNNCSDSIGYDDDGNAISGWNNNLGRFEDVNPSCTDTVYAVAQAEVFYQRPDCYAGAGDCDADDIGFSSLENGVRESANLYNPFWQVRLISTGAGDGQ